LNFVNPETRNLLPDNYSGEAWHLQSKGSLHGEYGGLKILLDAESFDFSYTGSDSLGFRITLTDQSDTASVLHDGYNFFPGFSLKNILRKAFTCTDPKSAKHAIKPSVFFCAFWF